MKDETLTKLAGIAAVILAVLFFLGCQSKVQTIYLESDSNQKECNK